MKFHQSDRIFHDPNFNPPCNYYNLDKKSEKKVLTGTLAGPKLIDDTKNTFNYAKRFNDNKNALNPGPGEYFQQKKQLVYDFKRDLSNPKKFLKNTFRSQEQIPSIPYKIIKQQNLNEEDKQFIKELHLLQNSAKASQSIKKKDPSFSFAKSPRKLISEKISQKKESSVQKIPNNSLYSDFQKNSEKQDLSTIRQTNQTVKNKQKSKANTSTINETIRKATKKRNEIINNIGPDFVPSLELIDLMSKMRTKYAPGPGFYNPNNNSFDKQVDSLTDSTKKGAIFSSVKRFNTDKNSLLGPGAYQINDQSFSKKGGLFSKQKRTILNVKGKTDIQYRFYINPNQKQMINVSRPQRSVSSTTLKHRNYFETGNTQNGFGSSSKRFSTASLPKVQIDKISQISDYQVQKKNNFKIQIKTRMKKLYSEDRRSTKEDSGLLGISTMATLID